MTATATEFETTELPRPLEPLTISISGAVQYTGMKESRIRALVRAGKLPIKVVGGNQDKYYYVLLFEPLRDYVLSLPDDPSELPTK